MKPGLVSSRAILFLTRRVVAAMLPVLVVHGGAGTIGKARAEDHCKGVRVATRAGFAILREGGSAMDAVVEAVTLLENSPLYNAGTVARLC